jgi:hypothetical protein
MDVESDGMYTVADIISPLSDTIFLDGTLDMKNWYADANIAGINRYKFNNDPAKLNHDIEYTAIAGGFEFFF